MLKACAFAALGIALFPASALGATAHVEGGDGRRTMVYAASPGEANQLEIALDAEAGTVTIHDSGAPITAGAGCVSMNANEVTCHPVDFEVSIRLGDRADDVLVTEGGIELHVAGGAGNDEMTACADCSALFTGEGGNDVLTGDHALVSGGPGNDVLTSVVGGPVGGRGNDILQSDSFSLWGGSGDDTITGGPGSNHIFAGNGDDTIEAGGGNDVVSPGRGSNSVNGGAGRDRLSYSDLRTRLVLHLDTGRARHLGDVDRVTNMEDAHGSGVSDLLVGDSNGNVFWGGGGADELRGARGDDRLWGGAGDDLLVGGGGSDRLRGKEGDDRLRARDRVRDLVAGGAGFDAARVDRGLDRVRSVERFF